MNAGTNAENYNISVSEGTLTVTQGSGGEKIPVTIQAKSGTFSYNGQEQTVSGFENEGANGIEIEIDDQKFYVTGFTSIATSKNAVTDKATTITGSPIVKDASGNDVTRDFSVVPVALQIGNKKRRNKSTFFVCIFSIILQRKTAYNIRRYVTAAKIILLNICGILPDVDANFYWRRSI